MLNSLFRRLAPLAAAAALAGSLPAPALSASSEALLLQGDRQWADGHPDAAQQSYQQALALDPRSARASMKLAGLELSQQHFSASVAAYKRTIGLDPKNAKAWVGLGFGYLHSGKNALSLAAFNQAMQLDPGTRPSLQPLLAKLAAQ